MPKHIQTCMYACAGMDICIARSKVNINTCRHLRISGRRSQHQHKQTIIKILNMLTHKQRKKRTAVDVGWVLL